MEKIGMTFEGIHRDHIKKWDHTRTLPRTAILADEWREQRE